LTAFELDEEGVNVSLESDTSGEKMTGSPGEKQGGGGRGTLKRLSSSHASALGILYSVSVEVDQWGVKTELHTGFLGAAKRFALLLLNGICVFDRLPPFIKMSLLTG